MLTEKSNAAPAAAAAAALRPSWRLKLPILLCTLFITLGATYGQNALSPLKSLIMSNTYDDGVPINNARYGVISAASTLVNTILPIIAGVVVDYYGVNFASLLCSLFVFVGNIVRAVGAQRGAFEIILAGQIFAGVGSISLNICQNKVYTHWFKGTAARGPGIIGFITGLDYTMNRTFSIIALESAVPIYHASGKWYLAFWVSAIFGGTCLILNIIYVFLEMCADPRLRIPTGHALNHVWGSPLTRLRTHGRRIVANIVLLPASFWLLAILQILQSGVVAAYKANLTDVVRVTRLTTLHQASWTSGLDQIVAIVLTPVVGLLFDFFGRRSYYVSWTAALYILTFALLGFTKVHELAPIIIGSLAYTINAIPFGASIPLLVRLQEQIGTAYGLWQAFDASGETIMNIAAGAIQDYSADKGAHLYDNMFYLLMALKAVEFFVGFTYHILDRRYFGSVMTMTEKQRVKAEENETEEERTQGLRVPRQFWTILGCTMITAMIITSYVVFIYYSVAH